MPRVIMTILLVGLVLTVRASSQDPSFAIRVNVAVVSLEAVVLNSNSPVTTLSREDFTVYEDGDPQIIQNFSSVESPYSILLLFQNTPSIASQRQFMVTASNGFLAALRPQDRVSIYSMELTTRRILDWRHARTGQEMNVKVGTPNGLLRFKDGLNDAFGKFGSIGGRKGIIVLTSGGDEDLYQETLQRGKVRPAKEDSSFQKLVNKVRERGIPLYFVAINTDRNLMLPSGVSTTGGQRSLVLSPLNSTSPAGSQYLFLKTIYPSSRSANFPKIQDRSPTIAEDFLTEVRSRMELLAEVSGGRIYFPKTLDDVVPLYEQIGKELGTSYSFGYTPSKAAAIGTTHRVEIRVSNPNLRVLQSRDAYTTR